VVRLVIFLSFLWLISLSSDIHRVFEYHGAEHRVVFNFESGKPLTVANAQSFTTWHPRCGTSFLLVVMLVSIVVYALIPVNSFMLRFLVRILALPFIMGISYEIIRFAAKHRAACWPLSPPPGCGCSGSRPSRHPTIRPRSLSARSRERWTLNGRPAENW